jgi:Spy/CpxP family protein refolding chaperone
MKTNKRFIKALFLTLFIYTGVAFAQESGDASEKKESIEAMKIAFITKKLDLSPQEAQQFWPVYNQYSEKTKELRKKRRQESRETRSNLDELSDKEVEQFINNDLINRQKELDLQKDYHEKFKAILPIKKVAKLYVAEEQFKVVLINKLKDKDRDQHPRNRSIPER